jgi:hypothetical protein
MILNPSLLQPQIIIQNPQGQGSQQPGPSTPNERVPTSLTVALNTYDCNMGATVIGAVTSNGYNYPVTIYVKYLGTGDQVSESGLLGADGRFTEARIIQLPGVWEVWATSSGVTSNKATLSVHGCRIVCDKTSVPFAPGSHIVGVKVYGDKSSVVTGFVNDPAHAISYPLPSVSTNVGGYASTTYDFMNKAIGDYEVDAIVNGRQASSFGASWWIGVK